MNSGQGSWWPWLERAQSSENKTSRCWETPNELNLNQAPFVGIFAFKLSGTSFVVVMQWRKLRKRLVYGLSPEN
ncbi:rCG27934 [Rattus norvegicus]|uniref:RCG27934 n=1 Tax=Rattus norvegicus TaxID=10116 RepID=A6IE47_RAT|nr:rCG27934 [Rattus norvegicus]